MRRAGVIPVFFFVLILPLGLASAVELSLEENRAQRGNIGYIDMQKVFKLFPETTRAKENFAEVVRQAEEQLNIRKAEILRLRAELSQMKFDRQEAAKTPAPSPAPAAPALPLPLPSPAAALPPATTATASVAVSSDAAAVSVSTAAISLSTASLIANLPGLTTTQTPPPAPSEPKKGLLSYSETSPPPSHGARFADLDAKIESKTSELAQKEKAYKEHQNEVEKNLLDLEGRRSEILLGKIHRVVKEVALKEGVSVVVDKGAILYGQDAVDLTDRVLKALKGS